MEKFQIGELVKLKSGGPVMTVNDVDVVDISIVYCKWFSGSKNLKDSFHVDSLEKVVK
jgi:uncharacterized protein YodC (DUF2158 family)